MRPTIATSFDYEGTTYRVEWYDIPSKDSIPDIAWHQAYVIGDLHGQVPLVTNAHSPNPYNLPGGRVEPGETLEQTLQRELVEECNMQVVSWEPLGYQLVTDPNGRQFAQFRAFAVLNKIGEFSHDPGGPVIANTLADFDEIESHIHHGDIGLRLMALARCHFVAHREGIQS